MRSALLLTLTLLAASLHAQAPASFSEGVLAFEKGEWANAERLMRETIAGNPNETAGTVRIAGEWYETYVPHYFLARALAKQKKCAEALVAFAESERQGVTPTISDFNRHLRTRGGCKPAGKTKPEKVVGEVVVPFGEEPETATAVPPPPSPKKISTPPPSKEVMSTPPPKKSSPPAPSETRVRLSAAVNAYLRGEYEMTARLLTQTQFQERAAAAEAALFRAAARHALYRSGGSRDAALREQVESDLRQYRELRPNASPDPRIFPPGFIALAR